MEKKCFIRLPYKFLQKPGLRNLVKYPELIIKQSQINSYLGPEEVIPGAFVDWDNTPRYVTILTVIQDSNPCWSEFLNQIKLVLDSKKISTLFINAWNEWGESI